MQYRGNRGNGESFLAEVWFSSYKEGATPKLAAIIADVSEEQAVPSGTGSARLWIRRSGPLSNSREMDVLRLVVQGLSNKEIASSMNISESAVKNTLQQLFGKTEVRTRSQLVRVALELSFDVPASCICGGRTSIVRADRFRTANGTAICCSFSIGS